jgi:hypothetical protein
MNVGDEQAEINRARSEFILEGETERSNSRSGVQNNEFAVSAHFHAGGITAVMDSGRARNWN